MDPFNLSARVDEATLTRAAATYRTAYGLAYVESRSNEQASEAALRAVIMQLGPRTDLAPVREDAPQIYSREGKQFAVVGKGWIMQPVGNVTAQEAKLICEQALSGGLTAPYQDVPPQGPTSTTGQGGVRSAQAAVRGWIRNCEEIRGAPLPDDLAVCDDTLMVRHLRAFAELDLGSVDEVPRPAPTNPDDPLWTAASDFEAEVRRIAGDYFPDHPNESGAALYQMRAALELALVTRADAELCRDEGCPNVAEPHVCVSSSPPTRSDYVTAGVRSGRITAVNRTIAPSTEQRDSLVETVRYVLDLLGRDTGAVTFNEAEQALVTYLARWPAADPAPASAVDLGPGYSVSSGRTVGQLNDIIDVAAKSHREALREAMTSQSQEDIDFYAMATALAEVDQMTAAELAEVRREQADLVALRAEAKELRAYLRAFVSATIDPHRRDMGEFLANPFVTYEFSHVDEDDTPEGYTITGGQVRRAAELVGYDVLKVAPPENTIAEELTQVRDLRLEVKKLREWLVKSEDALNKLAESKSPDEARLAAAADPVAAMDVASVLAEDDYLIVSVKHSRERVVTFWFPHCRGYTSDIRSVGHYSMSGVYASTDPDRLDPDRSFPVPRSVVWDALGRRPGEIAAPIHLLPVFEAAARVVLRAYADANPTTPATTKES